MTLLIILYIIVALYFLVRNISKNFLFSEQRVFLLPHVKTNSKQSVPTTEVQLAKIILACVELKIAMTSAYFQNEELPTSRTDEGTC